MSSFGILGTEEMPDFEGYMDDRSLRKCLRPQVWDYSSNRPLYDI